MIKRGPQGETVYVNQFFTIRNREVGTKHIFTGASRAVSKLMAQDKPGANPSSVQPREKDLYFYHPDHLGSTSYVTDTEGKLYQHLQYFPFGETWVEQATNTQRTPYRFTGKELDEETGLYYFGARYFDPRTSVWQSADPALGKFLPNSPRQRTADLPGIGGVYVSSNLSLFAYVGNNPLRFSDPNGEERIDVGVEGEFTFFSGFKLAAGVFADTETGEIGVKGTFGKRFGLSIGAGFNFGVSESGKEAENALRGSISGNVEGSFGPVSATLDIVTLDKEGVKVLEGGSIGVVIEEIGVPIQPKLKAGLTVGADFTGEVSTSIIPDTKAFISGMGEAVSRGLEAAETAARFKEEAERLLEYIPEPEL